MIGIIVLAAGNSSRLGQPKQLLLYKNKTLIKNIIDETNNLKNAKVVVVTGAERSTIEKVLKDSKVIFCHNEHWQQGMSSSLKAGLNKLLQITNNISAVIITVCDQPYITTDLLNKLIASCKNTNEIAACFYAETIGTPAIFPAKYFDELLQLDEKNGAKKLLLKYKNTLNQIHFENGNIDIDTLEDYHKLKQ